MKLKPNRFGTLINEKKLYKDSDSVSFYFKND